MILQIFNLIIARKTSLCCRVLTRIIIVVIIFATFLASCSDGAAADQGNVTEKHSTNAGRPNIVLILADDVGTGDLPFYWEGQQTTHVKLPNLQNFTDKSVLFTDAHSTPLCAPSRYMLLSGNYAHRGTHISGTWDTKSGQSQFRPHQKSIAEALRTEAGYQTGAFGKWHLGAKVPPDGMKTWKNNTRYMLSNKGHDWTKPLIQGPGDIGFDQSFITIAGIQNAPYSFFENDFLTTDRENVKYWTHGNYSMPYGTSLILHKKGGEGDLNWDASAYDMILVNKTRNFIDNHLDKRPDDPFFAYVALGAVHEPFAPPDHYSDGTPVKGLYETRHLDMIGEMDKVVGSINKIIEDRNLAENTIVIFTSDNGGLDRVSRETGHRTSGPLRGAKSSIYEGGHRVPLIIRYDGKFTPGARRNRMVGLNDLYATICELVRIDIPDGSAQDSVSFASYAEKDKNQKGLRTFLGTWGYKHGDWQAAIRRHSLKLVHHIRNNTFEMYNLNEDISETRNIINYTWPRKWLGTMREHLQNIGPCPDKNVRGFFNVTLFSGVVERHNCDWFREQRTRCKQSFEGELNCAAVCGRYNEKCKSNYHEES